MEQLLSKLELYKKELHAREKRKREGLSFEFGTQDIVDFISYAGLKEKETYMVLDDTYIRTLYISGYPYLASTGWLNMLINFNHNCDISYHIEEIDAHIALPKLRRKITELESTKRAMLKRGSIVGAEILDPLESAISLKNKIQRGQEKLFQVSIYITLIADSLLKLHTLTTLLQTTMATKLFYTKVAIFQQQEGLESVLPRAENKLKQKRNLDSSSAALTFPFVSSELVQENGILYGVNKTNSSLVIVDRFSLQNANSIIFAQSGSGKSYTAKVEILRHLIQGTNVIIIDPEREYEQLAKSVKGTVITCSANSKEKINPFDINLNQSTLSSHMQDLTEIIALILEGLGQEEKAVIDKAILLTYKKFGYSLRGTKKVGEYPLLKDLYKTLKELKEKKLTLRLEKFITGSLSSVFNGQTNVELSNRLIVFDIKELPESLRQIMMIVISHFVYNQLSSSKKKRLLVIDEGWLLLSNPQSAHFIAGLTRRARKNYLGVSIISQQANDFLNNEYGKAIASQSSLRILMRQDTTTIKKVTREFGLSEYEQKFLLTCDRGEALLIADQNHVAVTIVASEKEHPLITTDPRELLKM